MLTIINKYCIIIRGISKSGNKQTHHLVDSIASIFFCRALLRASRFKYLPKIVKIRSTNRDENGPARCRAGEQFSLNFNGTCSLRRDFGLRGGVFVGKFLDYFHIGGGRFGKNQIMSVFCSFLCVLNSKKVFLKACLAT